MQFSATPYPSTSFSEMKRRSLILASGIESILPSLPTISDQHYGLDRRPCVKWVYLPRDNRYEPDIDLDGKNSVILRQVVSEIFPDMGVRQNQGDISHFFWVFEEGRPTVASIVARLPAMYLLGSAIECHLEGWAFMDDEAWRYGLNNFMRESGFDSDTILPGEM
jgi:hypothetical protein